MREAKDASLEDTQQDAEEHKNDEKYVTYSAQLEKAEEERKAKEEQEAKGKSKGKNKGKKPTGEDQ